MNYQLIVKRKRKIGLSKAGELYENVIYVGYDPQFALQLVENINNDDKYDGWAELEVYRDGERIE